MLRVVLIGSIMRRMKVLSLCAMALSCCAQQTLAQTELRGVQTAQSTGRDSRKAKQTGPQVNDPRYGEAINEWTIGLAAGLPEGTFLPFAAEIARNLNDGSQLRVLPIVTPGATENVRDLLYLKGVDIAITHTDVLEHFKQVEKIPNIERRVRYITGLYASEIHVVARPEYKTLKDLAGKKVGFHTLGSGSTVTAPIIFDRLGIGSSRCS